MNYLNSKSIGILIPILLMANSIFAQDVIYKRDATKVEGAVSSIDKGFISFLNNENVVSAQDKLEAASAALVFFENGQYLTFPNAIPEPMELRQFVNLSYDVIVTVQNEVILGEIEEVNQEQELVRYRVLEDLKGSIRSRHFTGLVACIYKNGAHALFKHPVDAISHMNAVHNRIRSLVKKRKKKEVYQPAIFDPSKKEEKVVVTTENDKPSPNVATVNPANTNQNNQGFGNIANVDFEEYSGKALKKIEDLGAYLEVIADKQTEIAEANKAIKLAVELFIDESAVVEISSTNYEQIIKRTIGKYLNNLKRLKYDRVEVKWADINYVSDFRKGNDGNYYGTVSVKQTFQGISDGEVVYSDVTEKHVEVVLKSFEKQIGGQSNMVWDVLLSDLGVYNTNVKG